ncbi:MAG: SDR family NAD(P)-dependent oxidoreductase [Gammaproteobacteria bacterium]|nr:SDR family NAD(P)-dependent oxidoreductase [Gammaproteobacteria bacterium]
MKQVILITGCSSGIGLCLAENLHTLGHRVFATARKPDDVARLAARGMESLHLDLDDPASIHAAVDEVVRRTQGRIDVLINNGAYGQPGAVEDLRREVLRAQFETNLFGTAELINRVIPLMRAQQHGRIINIGSLLGFVALPYRGAYNATKYALEGLTDTLRLELADTGIFVSLIEPGPIKSKFRANGFVVYRKNIDAAHSAHRERYAALERRLAKPGPAAPFTLPPEAVLCKVLRALASRRPRARYYVTFPSYLFAVLRRLLPTRALDWILSRISRGEMR